VTAQPLQTAERLLELIESRASGAEAEVTVRRGTDALTRFANGFIHQNVAEEADRVSLRLAVDGHVASATLDGRPDEAAMVRLIDGVLEAARVRPADPEWPGLAPAAPLLEVEHWDDATAAASPDERATRVGAFVEAAAGLETAGSCQTTAATVAFANSAGQRAVGRSTSGDLDGIARTGTSDGSARASSVAVSALDGRATGERAAAKARQAADPTDLEPGRYEVVLEPQCVANILQFLFAYGINGRAVEEGRSFVRLGEQQFDPSISVADDITHPDQVGVAFDAEGTPKRRLEVVAGGRTQAVLHSRRTAARAGAESTGHAVAGAETWGPLPANVVLAPGEASLDELIGRMERGILVTDFWYTRVLDPRTQVVTGLTRNGVWLVENGVVVRPVRNLRFTQSFLEALAPGAVLGIGSDASLMTNGFIGAALVPSVHLASWNFTGGAQG
jgi:predicted Zn-dependent protease